MKQQLKPFKPRHHLKQYRRHLIVMLLPLLLGACAVTAPARQIESAVASQWQSALPAADKQAGDKTNTTASTLPHQGSVQALNAWWSSLGDPLLVELINNAQAASPSISAANTRITQARSAVVAAGAATSPILNAATSVSRGVSQVGTPVASVAQLNLQASWELDLWGGNRAAQTAAQARLAGSEAAWHEARVSVAAELANLYLSFRTCEQLLAVASDDAASRAETSRLTDLLSKAGFSAPAFASLARASAAQAQSSLTQQRSQCDSMLKALVALSTFSEPELRQKLAVDGKNTAYAAINKVAHFSLPTLPAQLLTQRPDVFAAEQEVAAAIGDVGSAEAAKYPRLSLMGSVAVGKVRINGENSTATTWSIGPLSLSLPILDGGRTSAAIDTAKANYETAVTSYRAKVRAAVREVEDALLSLQSSKDRLGDAKISNDGYGAAFTAAQARYKSGLGSLTELEDARRAALAAKTALIHLEREQSAAWVALYRALGGGWTLAANETRPAATATLAKN